MTSATDPAAFAVIVKTARKAAGLSQRELAERLTEEGFDTSGSNVGAWERGEWSPRDPGTVIALDNVLGTGGALMHALGIVGDDTYRRLQADAVVQRLEQMVEEAREARTEILAAPHHGSEEPLPLPARLVEIEEQIEFLWNTIEALISRLRRVGVDLPEDWLQQEWALLDADTKLAKVTELVRESAILPEAATSGKPVGSLGRRTQVVPVGDVPEEPDPP